MNAMNAMEILHFYGFKVLFLSVLKALWILQ